MRKTVASISVQAIEVLGIVWASRGRNEDNPVFYSPDQLWTLRQDHTDWWIMYGPCPDGYEPTTHKTPEGCIQEYMTWVEKIKKPPHVPDELQKAGR